MIQVQNVTKGFWVRDKRTLKKKRIEAVRNISFTVQPGEIYGLLGPNGAGKSTTLRMIASLMQPEEGHISVCGLSPVTQGRDIRALLGFLATDMDIYERLTPKEQLVLFGELQGLSGSEADRRAGALLTELGMKDFMNIKMDGFSSGQRQKVNIARALLHDPKVIIFDEPTTGLDVLTAKVVLDLLLRLRQEGKTVILSTHILPMVHKICNRVGIIYEGQLYGDSSPLAICEQYQVNTLDEVFFNLAEAKPMHSSVAQTTQG